MTTFGELIGKVKDGDKDKIRDVMRWTLDKDEKDTIIEADIKKVEDALGALDYSSVANSNEMDSIGKWADKYQTFINNATQKGGKRKRRKRTRKRRRRKGGSTTTIGDTIISSSSKPNPGVAMARAIEKTYNTNYAGHCKNHSVRLYGKPGVWADATEKECNDEVKKLSQRVFKMPRRRGGKRKKTRRRRRKRTRKGGFLLLGYAAYKAYNGLTKKTKKRRRKKRRKNKK